MNKELKNLIGKTIEFTELAHIAGSNFNEGMRAKVNEIYIDLDCDEVLFVLDINEHESYNISKMKNTVHTDNGMIKWIDSDDYPKNGTSVEYFLLKDDPPCKSWKSMFKVVEENDYDAEADKQYKKHVMETLLKKIRTERQIDDLTIGYLRYECLRKRNLNDLKQITKRNMKGELFDDIIDEYVIKDYHEKC